MYILYRNRNNKLARERVTKIEEIQRAMSGVFKQV
jgi:hypothetical protein